MSEPLTERQQAYVDNRIQGMSKFRSALDAGYSEASAHVAVRAVEKSPAVQESLRQAMERASITSARLADKLSEGLEATSVMRQTQFASREVVPDYGERRQAIELAAKLRGDLDSAAVSVTFNQAILGVPEEFAGMFGLIETPLETTDGASKEGESVIELTPQDVVNGLGSSENNDPTPTPDKLTP